MNMTFFHPAVRAIARAELGGAIGILHSNNS
jgi:hypothetical protein